MYFALFTLKEVLGMKKTVWETICRLQERAETSYNCIINDDRAIGNRLEAYEEAKISDNVSTLTFRVKINNPKIIEVLYGDKNLFIGDSLLANCLSNVKMNSVGSIIDAIIEGTEFEEDNTDEIIKDFLESIPSLEDELSNNRE